jgi:hypothetical protein
MASFGGPAGQVPSREDQHTADCWPVLRRWAICLGPAGAAPKAFAGVGLADQAAAVAGRFSIRFTGSRGLPSLGDHSQLGR